MAATSIAADGSTVLLIMDVFPGFCLVPWVGLRSLNSTLIADIGKSATGALDLLSRCSRAAAAWIRCAQQFLVGHRDRIGRGPRQWFDHAMALGPQRRQGLLGKAVLDPHFIR